MVVYIACCRLVGFELTEDREGAYDIKENLLLRKMQRPIRDWGLHASYQYLNWYVNTGLLSEVLLSCEKVSFKGLS